MAGNTAKRRRDELFAFLGGLGIAVTTTTVPPAGLHRRGIPKALRDDMPGGHTKNLFLKDKKGNYFLLTVGGGHGGRPEDDPFA